MNSSIAQTDKGFLLSSQIIVKEVLKQLDLTQINSVVDFGCGIGTWLKTFKDNGIKTIKGFDGDWIDKGLLFKNISPKDFESIDFEYIEQQQIFKKYDLVLCLEVAEHISEKKAEQFINCLTQSGNIVLFSAAIPYQGGVCHINEQWPDYWHNIFSKYNYKPYDTIRHKIWDDDRIFYWYRQNILLYINDMDESLVEQKKKLLNESLVNNDVIMRLIHPDCYLSKCDNLK